MDRNASRLEELLDLGPILPDNVIRADVPATAEGLQRGSRKFRKQSGAFVGHIRIVLGVKHHQFRPVDFRPMMARIVEGAASELPPIRIRKAVSIAERFADVLVSVRPTVALTLTIRCGALADSLAREPIMYSSISVWTNNLDKCRG